MKTGYRLDISYNLFTGDDDSVLIAAVGKDTCDSGAGFGQRDLGWEFQKLEDATAAKQRVEALPNAQDFTISISPLHR